MATKINPSELPAGAARDEAKAIVKDQLEEEIDRRSQEGGAFDPAEFEIDNEIAQNYNFVTNEFEVIHPVAGYTYLWGRKDMRSHMEIMTRVQRYMGNNIKGYELVKGDRKDFPECWHLKSVDGTRVIGDCQLYRVPTPVYHELRRRQDLLAKARDMGVSAGALEYAARHPNYVHVHETDGDPIEAMRGRAQQHGMSRAQYDREMAMSLAVHKMAEDARDGNLYGMPVEKAVPRK